MHDHDIDECEHCIVMNNTAEKILDLISGGKNTVDMAYVMSILMAVLCNVIIKTDMPPKLFMKEINRTVLSNIRKNKGQLRARMQ